MCFSLCAYCHSIGPCAVRRILNSEGTLPRSGPRSAGITFPFGDCMICFSPPECGFCAVNMGCPPLCGFCPVCDQKGGECYGQGNAQLSHVSYHDDVFGADEDGEPRKV